MGGITTDEDRTPDLAQVSQRAVGDPVVATVEVQNSWGNGYVANVAVCNNGTEPTTNWQVELDLHGGPLIEAWGVSTEVQPSGTWLFEPVEWAKTIWPSQCQTAGFKVEAAAGTVVDPPTLVGTCWETASGGDCSGSGTGGSGGTGGTTSSVGGSGGGSSGGSAGASPSGGTGASAGTSSAGGSPAGGTAGSSSGGWGGSGGSGGSGGTAGVGATAGAAGSGGSPPTPNQLILGFEEDSAWQVTNGSATLSLTDLRIEGSHSMLVQADSGWFEVTSAPLSSLSPVASRAAIYLRVPDTGDSWAGQAEIRLYSSTIGLNGELLGTLNFTAKPHDTFFRFNLPMSDQLRFDLGRSYDDLTVRITFNVPVGGTYLVDLLWFGQGTLPTELYTEKEVTISLPHGLEWNDVALYATEEMRVNDRVEVRELLNDWRRVVSMGSLNTNIGVDAKIGELWSLPEATLRSNSRVFGDLLSTATTVLL